MSMRLSDIIYKRAEKKHQDKFHVMPRYAQALRNAQHFVLTHDAALVANSVTNTKPSTLMQALTLCKLPYKRMFLEWHSINDDLEMNENEVVGAYLEEIIDEEGLVNIIVSLCSACKEDGETKIFSSQLASLYRFDKPFHEIDDEFAEMARKEVNRLSEEGKLKKSWSKEKYLNKEEEFTALLKMASHSDTLYNPFAIEFWDDMRDRGEIMPKEQFSNIKLSMANDVRLAISLILLLNSKNCVHQEAVDVSETNKIRKRLKQPLSSGYIKTDLRLSKTQRNVLNARGINPREARQHLVMGHYKTRKTGVYWWNKHERCKGNPEAIRTEYDVDE